MQEQEPQQEPKPTPARIVVPVTIGVTAVALLTAYSVALPFAHGVWTNLKGTDAADATPLALVEPADQAASDEDAQSPTKLVAQCNGVDVYAPIETSAITAVLFHQASYAYALPLTTELPKADAAAAKDAQQVRVNHDQTDGDWLDADALHLWRSQDSTEMDTAIDVGATAGTTVYAPVTGTVVLVKDYQLYNRVPDIEIHIQPDGHPEMDCVAIHITDAQVQAGDHVEGGVTPIASVRDIACSIDGIQLSDYTPADDPGNHTHIQVNNADYPGYREKKLQGAITVQ